jgi:hypothetical protein
LIESINNRAEDEYFSIAAYNGVEEKLPNDIGTFFFITSWQWSLRKMLLKSEILNAKRKYALKKNLKGVKIHVREKKCTNRSRESRENALLYVGKVKRL